MILQLIVSIIVVCAIIWQVLSCRSTFKRIRRIQNLFPKSDTGNTVVQHNNKTEIYRKDASGDFEQTLDDINRYLAKNENKTFDYHIIKEIVERNVQSLEEEVDTMLSAPLYIGLMATILSIAIGVIVFALNDLSSLLAGSQVDKGITVLLTDVGIAMISSFAGVLCTKISTQKYNTERTEMDRRKNVFLSWIQSDLMSKLSDDITGALIKMTTDLNEFNRTFAQNTQELKETLQTVNDNYKGQVQLLEAVDKLKINKIASANIEVYDKLHGCTNEIEKLLQVVSNSETYVARVTELNNNLGSIESRTKVFEELGVYFKGEIEYVKDRQGYMRQQMSGLDSVLQDALNLLGENVKQSLQELTSVFQQQNQRIQELIESQQTELSNMLSQQQHAVTEKIVQFSNPFEGIKDSFDKALQDITAAFTAQNDAIKEMLHTQQQLLETSLQTQQKSFLQELKNAPSQSQVLSDISKTLDRLCSKMDAMSRPSNSTGHNNIEKERVDWLSRVETYVHRFLPIGVAGTFFSLLILIIILLCKL